MSKVLTPLEAFKEIGKLKADGCCINTIVEYKIVERVLEACDVASRQGLFDDMESILEASVIIMEHKLLNYVFKNEKCASMYHLTNEEIDKLKEAFR